MTDRKAPCGGWSLLVLDDARTVEGVNRRQARGWQPLAGALASVVLAACAGETHLPRGVASEPAQSVAPGAASPEPDSPSTDVPSATTTPKPSAQRPRPEPEPRRSYLTIPRLGLRSVAVVRYPGTPDDAAGTRIQNGGPAASPRGRGGGVGPGEVGNFIVTGHRTSHSAPFRDLPAVRKGDRVQVRSGDAVYVYRITTTRWTSFRSARSLAEQSAAVPGRPGAVPVQPMITLSTCATYEDHAAGNYWSDRFGNPEHRIDKVGVLVAEKRFAP